MEPPIYTDPATGRRYYVGQDGQSHWLDGAPMPQAWGAPAPSRSARQMPAHRPVQRAGMLSGLSRRTKAELMGASAVLVLGVVIGDASNNSVQPVGASLAGLGDTPVVTTTTTAYVVHTVTTSASSKATTKPKSKPKSKPKKSTSKPKPTEQEAAYYANCSAARAAGAAPLYVGDPGYRRALDRDGDGVACE